MQASVKAESGRLILHVSGVFTFADNKEWRAIVENMLEQEAEVLVLDITVLDKIDSAGLGMMMAMKKWVEDKDRKMLLRFDPNTMVGSMIRLAKFNEMFEIELD